MANIDAQGPALLGEPSDAARATARLGPLRRASRCCLQAAHGTGATAVPAGRRAQDRGLGARNGYVLTRRRPCGTVVASACPRRHGTGSALAAEAAPGQTDGAGYLLGIAVSLPASGAGLAHATWCHLRVKRVPGGIRATGGGPAYRRVCQPWQGISQHGSWRITPWIRWTCVQRPAKRDCARCVCGRCRAPCGI